MIALFATTTACGVAPVDSVGSAGPCEPRTRPPPTASRTSAASSHAARDSHSRFRFTSSRSTGARLTNGVRRPLLLPQLEPVAERILRKRSADAGNGVVPARIVARLPQARAQRFEVVDDEAGMGLARRGERLLDAEVQLLRAGAEPDAATCAQLCRLRKLREAEHAAVERACR